MRFWLRGVFLAGLLFTTAAHANSNEFSFGTEGYYYQYREPSFAKLEGEAGGFTLDDTYKIGQLVFLQGDGHADFGRIHYSSNGTGSTDGISDFTGEARAMGGLSFAVATNTSASFFTGMGYRQLFDNRGSDFTTTGASLYDRRSQYLYVPIGLSSNVGFQDFAVNLTGEFDYLVHGWQDSYLRDAGFDNNIQNNQEKGFGLRGSISFVPADIPFLSLGVFARYWNIRDSDYQPVYLGGSLYGYGQEPANTTLETGVQAKIRI